GTKIPIAKQAFVAPCGDRNSAHMQRCAGLFGGCALNPGLAPSGGPFRMSLTKEDMPCELLILLPSIVRLSALIGCSRSLIRSPDMTAHLVTRPTTSSALAITSIALR